MHRIEWIKSKVNLQDTILEVGVAENPLWGGTPFKVTTLDRSVRPEEQCFPDIVGKAENLPSKNKAFDIVCEGELLEHVTDPQQVLQEAVRVARNKVILTVPYEHLWPPELKPFQNPGHVRFYTHKTFKDELQQVGLTFNIEEIRHGPWAWLGAEIQCNTAGMEWADYQSLTRQEYFLISRGLLDIEIALGKEVTDSLHWSRRFEYPWLYLNLQPFSKEDIVLDAGGGETALQFLLSKEVKEIHNIDLLKRSIDWVNKVKRDKGFKNVFPVLGDLTNMTFPSEYFDKAVCISTLEHVAKDKVTDGIEELVRVTKPGGKIAITMDVVLEKTDKQTDLIDFEKIARKYSLTIPQYPEHMMIFRVPPYNFPFTIACILLKKDY